MKDLFKNIYENEAEELLITISQIPSWTGGERKRAEFCRNYLTALGWKNVIIDEVNNVILEIKLQPGNANTVIMAHLDTVFSEKDDFTVKKNSGRLSCPGIGDNTANAVGLLLLAKYIKLYDIVPDTGLYLVWDSGEEGLGNLIGCRTFIEQHEGRIGAFIGLDLYFNKIFTKCVGSIRYRITVSSEGGHSYLDFGKKNAICEMAEIIHEVSCGESYNTDGLTYNVGNIDGGQSVNSIAAECSMLFEFRSEDSNKMNTAAASFMDMLERRNGKDCEITTEILGLRPCGETINKDIHSKLINSAVAAIEDCGCSRPELAAASTDCNIPLSKGIPSICFGLCKGGGAHTKGEWIEEGSVVKGVEILLTFYDRYFMR